MTPENLQLVLAILGWLVAFLLGKELAAGYKLWRAQHAERRDDHRRG